MLIPVEPVHEEYFTPQPHFPEQPAPNDTLQSHNDSNDTLQSHNDSPLPETATPIRRSDRVPITPKYLNDNVHLAHKEPYYLATLTNLSLQPPSLSTIGLSNSSQ